MSWQELNRYFSDYNDSFIERLFSNCENPWEPLSSLSKEIEAEFKDATHHKNIKGTWTRSVDKDASVKDQAIFIKETTLLDTPFIDADMRIFIGAGTLVESGATIKNNTIVRENCEIRQGAYLRGNCYIGPHCTVGHTTEMKNTIFIQHSEAGHFAYIGDSIIGSYVNLGAGTKISNLEFRSLEAKQRVEFPEIKFTYEGERFNTGVSKFGAIIGDGGETGCNSVLSPFVFMEPRCWVLPCACVPKGVYKRRTILRGL